MAAYVVIARLLAALLLAALCGGARAAAVPQTVSFPSLERDAAGRNVALRGFLLLPRTPRPAAGYPAVVALHGCGGLYSRRKGHEAELSERMVARAELYLADGFAVLFPDSFGSREVREVCTVKIGERTITAYRRRLDALAALDYLAHRGDIAAERVALLGWSHGGSTVLQSINVRDPEVAAFRAASPVFFRAAVAFYPGCSSPAKALEHWQPGVPTRIHVGALDDWTPMQACVGLGHAMAARGEDFDVATYAGAYHGFDAPSGRLVHRDDVPNGVHPGRGVTVGPNPGARAIATVRVRAFLRDRLAP